MFTKVHKPIPSSRFRANLAESLRDAKKKPLVITTERGLDSFVVLGIDLYNKMIERLEDEIDSRMLVEAILEHKKSGEKMIPLEEVMKKHRKKKR